MGVPNEQNADLLGHTTTRMVDETYWHRLRLTVVAARDHDWRLAEGVQSEVVGQAAQFILGCLFWVGFAFFVMARRRARVAAWESEKESERRLDEAVRQWKAQHPDKDSGDANLEGH